jgi:hypothetical protein
MPLVFSTASTIARKAGECSAAVAIAAAMSGYSDRTRVVVLACSAASEMAPSYRISNARVQE